MGSWCWRAPHRFRPERAPAGHGAQPKVLTPLWVGPAFSGTWFNPDRSGEGWVLEVLDDGSALLLWFTYPPAGSPAQQAGHRAGGPHRRRPHPLRHASTTRGPRFGAGFDPARLEFFHGGDRVSLHQLQRGEVTYAGRPLGARLRAASRDSPSTRARMRRQAQAHQPGRRRDGRAAPAQRPVVRSLHNGEGWALEELPDGRALAFWFTYDENGEQAWTIGTSAASGARLDVADNARPVGTRFGAGFNAALVNREPWGRVEFDFENCDAGTLRYASTRAAFGSGTLRPVRLTRLAATACLMRRPPRHRTDVEHRSADPQPQSEMAVASMAGMTYIAGGFGDTQVQALRSGARRMDDSASVPAARTTPLP